MWAAFFSSIALASLFATNISGQQFGGQTPPPPLTIDKRHDYKLTFKPPYFFTDLSIPFFHHFGAVFPGNHSIRLSSSVPGQSGAIFSDKPNPYNEWEVEFGFKIYGRKTYGSDGLAFWYVKEAKEGPVMGCQDKWNGVGVFFDTLDSAHGKYHPFVMGVYNDGNELKGLPDPRDSKFGGCEREFRNTIKPVNVKVVYMKNILEVYVNVQDDGKGFIKCFEQQNIHLPTGYYFGVSASSSNFADDHDVLYMQTFQRNAPALRESELPLRPYERERKESGHTFQFNKEDETAAQNIQQKIENLQREQKNNQLNDEDVGGEQAIHLLYEHQVRIMERLEQVFVTLRELPRNIPQSSPSSPPAHDSNSRIQELKFSIEKLETGQNNVINAMNRLTAELGGKIDGELYKMHGNINDLKNKIDMSQRQSREDQAKLVEQSASGFMSFPMFIGLQVVIIVVIYYIIRMREKEASKKFI